MHTFHHMISLVTDSGTQAITPAFDQRFGIQHITLLSMPSLMDRAHRLAETCRQVGKASDVEQMVTRWKPQALREQLQHILSGCNVAHLIINLSGATPVEAIELAQLARSMTIPAFVIEPEVDKAVWIERPASSSTRMPELDVADTLSLSQYFIVHGYQLNHAMATLKQRNYRAERIAKFMADLAVHSPRTLLRLNRAGAELDENLRSFIHFDASDWHALGFLAESGYLRWHHQDRVQFASGEARNFLCGGWLETFVFATVAELAHKLPIQDAATGVIVTTQDRVSNEFDVALIANNQLYLIECKARGPRRASGVGMDTLFKLDSLAGQMGLNSRAMLVSLAKPTHAEQMRAEAQGIEILAGGRLLRLSEELQQWLSRN
ncbi:DUF1887 family CARF protein [Chitinivorax sp. B]|uniref:Card1-like endonuclease domain-containing protein n=1 Tax=Chitinivorax sp. B TaxID=2502235 RepID=UPI0010F8B660|nr:DUF1887 family CARF protein [Chitinivorax sp. B]